MNKAMGLLANPAFMAGMGILGASQPSRNPVNPYQGGLLGLSNAGMMQAQMQQAEVEKQRRDMEMAEFQRQQAQAQAQAEAMAQFSRQVPPEDRALFQADPQGYMKSVFESRKPTSPTTLMQNLQAAGVDLQSPEGQKMMREAIMKPSTQINMPGAKPDRTLTPEEAAAFGIPPEEAASFMVGFDGSLKRRPAAPSEEAGKTEANKRATDRAVRGQALEEGESLITDYLTRGGEFSGTTVPAALQSPAGAQNAQASRNSLVAWVAKNVLGTPGAEPSPALYDRAEEIVPDFSGPYDSRMFDQRMQALREMMRTKFGGEAEVGNSLDNPARPTSDEEFNALQSGAYFIDPDDGQPYRKP